MHTIIVRDGYAHWHACHREYFEILTGVLSKGLLPDTGSTLSQECFELNPTVIVMVLRVQHPFAPPRSASCLTLAFSTGIVDGEAGDWVSSCPYGSSHGAQASRHGRLHRGIFFGRIN